MRVLLLSPNRLKEPYPITPLGAACVAGAVREAGHEVALKDIRFESDTRHGILNAIDDFGPDIIGISVRNVDNCYGLAPASYHHELRDVVDDCLALSDATIVLGGAGFSVLPREILDYCGLNIGIVGEGERAFPLLLQALESKGDVSDVPGIVWRDQAHWVTKAPLASDLVGFPKPAFDLIDRAYRALSEGLRAGVETKRGCVLSCAYCTYPLIQGHRVRVRPPKAVALDMKVVAEAGVASTVDFVDSVFNYPVDHAVDVCDALVAEHVDISWGVTSFNPSFGSGKLLQKMSAAGCRRISFGADAASEKMLASLGKGFNIDDLRKSLVACKATDMEVTVYLLFGGPGEDESTIRESLSFMEDLKVANLTLLYGIRLYPRTPIVRMLESAGQLPAGQGWLEPRYYFSPGLTDGALNVVREFLDAHPKWIGRGQFRSEPVG